MHDKTDVTVIKVDMQFKQSEKEKTFCMEALLDTNPSKTRLGRSHGDY